MSGRCGSDGEAGIRAGVRRRSPWPWSSSPGTRHGCDWRRCSGDRPYRPAPGCCPWPSWWRQERSPGCSRSGRRARWWAPPARWHTGTRALGSAATARRPRRRRPSRPRSTASSRSCARARIRPRSLQGAATDPEPASAVLRPAATAAALGDGVPAALEAEAARRPEVARDLRRVAGAWALAEQHGVPLADLLAGVHADLRWRLAYAGRVGAALAGPRATAAVLTATARARHPPGRAGGRRAAAGAAFGRPGPGARGDRRRTGRGRGGVDPRRAPVGGAAMNQPLAALALAAAMLLGSGRPGSGRLRGTIAGPVAGDDARGDHGRAREMVLGGLAVGLLAWAITGSPPVAVVAGAGGCGLPVVLHRLGRRPARADDAVELASAWAGMAVCLEAGLPVAVGGGCRGGSRSTAPPVSRCGGSPACSNSEQIPRRPGASRRTTLRPPPSPAPRPVRPPPAPPSPVPHAPRAAGCARRSATSPRRGRSVPVC